MRGLVALITLVTVFISQKRARGRALAGRGEASLIGMGFTAQEILLRRIVGS